MQARVTIRDYLGAWPPVAVAGMLALLATIGWFALAGPRVPVAGGLGWDGKIYGACAMDLAACLESGRYSAYSLGRLFPSVLVRSMLAIVGGQAEPSSVVRAFALLNMAWAWLGIALWIDICRRLQLQVATAVFGLSAMFLNFAMLRLAFYAPVSTDYTAYFFALATAWVLVAGRPLAALLVMVPAGLTWPASIPLSSAVGILRHRAPAATRGPTLVSLREGISRLLPWLTVGAFLSAVAYFLVVDPRPMSSGAVQIDKRWLVFAIALSAGYVFWAARALASARGWEMLRASPGAVAVALLPLLAYVVLSGWFKGFAGTSDPMDVSLLLRALATSGLIYPGAWLVAHSLYFGAWTFAFVCALPRVLVAVGARIPVLLPMLALGAVFLLLAESRGLVFVAPFLVLALAIAVDGALTWRTSVIFVLASLLLSHVWLPLPTESFGPLLEFPAQRMFLHVGPWMSAAGYAFGLVQAAVAAVLAALLLRDLRAPRLSQDQAPRRSR